MPSTATPSIETPSTVTRVFTGRCSRFFQLAVIFTDECDKLKELTHCHSFSYDFHLRTIQDFIKGQLVFKKGYHVTGLLRDFIRHFPSAPSYARSGLLEGQRRFVSSGFTTVGGGTVGL